MIGSRPRSGDLARLAIPAAVIFVCAAALGWNAGDTEVPKTAPAPPIRWSLPQPVAADPAKDLVVIAGERPWKGEYAVTGSGLPGGGTASAGPAPPAPPIWRLAGIVERGADSFALIVSGSGPERQVAYLRIGDALPDGSRLVALSRDSATAAGGKPPADGSRVYRLFGEKP